jgi:hypothetical protein
MPISDHIKRTLLDTIVSNINEMIIGFDGIPSTSSDGAAGRPAITLNPTVRIVDESTILVEGFIPASEEFDDTLKEVYVQFRGSSSFTPVARHTILPITKTSQNEVRIQLLIEVK